MVKNMPIMQETYAGSLGWKDSLEKKMATHSSIFAWRIPWTEESGGLQSMGSQRIRHVWETFTLPLELSGECMLLGYNKDLEWQTLKPSAHHSSGSWTDRIIALRQISITALFCLENSKRIHPPGVRACRPKDAKRREWGSAPAHRRESVHVWLLF